MYYSLLLVICVILLDVGSFARRRRQPHPARVCGPTQKERWSYEGANGPYHWAKLMPVSCNGSSQSPIDIITSDVVVDNSLGELQFDGYDQNVTKAVIYNDGHSIYIETTDSVDRTIYGGGLNGTYHLERLHFHWGYDNLRGSEHAIDGQKFRLEIQLVHKNEFNQIAILAVLCWDGPSAKYLPLYETLSQIRSAVWNVTYKGDRQPIVIPLNLESLFPEDKSFYRYQGSLTKPDCDEGVTWTVFKNFAKLNGYNLWEFLALKSSAKNETEECWFVHNYRPLQPLNNRIVTSNA